MALSAQSQRSTYPLAAYNFRVSVGSTAMSFSEVSGLSREYQTLSYRHGLSFWEGEEIAKFRHDKFAPLTLKKGVVAGAKALYEWLESEEKRSVSVSLCDEQGAAVVTWRIKKALLVKIEAPTLQASGNEVAIESMTLMASGITIETS